MTWWGLALAPTVIAGALALWLAWFHLPGITRPADDPLARHLQAEEIAASTVLSDGRLLMIVPADRPQDTPGLPEGVQVRLDIRSGRPVLAHGPRGNVGIAWEHAGSEQRFGLIDPDRPDQMRTVRVPVYTTAIANMGPGLFALGGLDGRVRIARYAGGVIRIYEDPEDACLLGARIRFLYADPATGIFTAIGDDGTQLIGSFLNEGFGAVAPHADRAPGPHLDRAAFPCRDPVTGDLALDTVTIPGPTIRWRVHSAYPQGLPVLGEMAYRVGEELNRRSQGKIRITTFGPGEIVGGNDYFNALGKGVVDAAFGTPSAHTDVNPAFSFLSTIPFALGSLTVWALSDEYQALLDAFYQPFGLKALACGYSGPESTGWFVKPIETLKDLEGLRIQHDGFAADVLERLGAQPVQLPPADVAPSLEAGLIDAAHFSRPYMDRALGVQQLAKFMAYPDRFHPGTIYELAINLDRWNELPAQAQDLIRQVCHQNIEFGYFRDQRAAGTAILQMQDDGVTVFDMPDDFWSVAFAEWQAVTNALIEGDPDARRIWISFDSFR